MRFAAECYRVLKNNAHAYFFIRYDCYPHHYECLSKAGFRIKNCLVIEKGTVGGIGDLKSSYANNAEWIIFCAKGRRSFNQTELLRNKKKPGMVFGKGRKPSKEFKTRFNTCWFGGEYPKATYNSNFQKKNGIYHPTIKNVECLKWLIQISTDPGDIVLDPFMGSGSTAVAAKETQRLYLGSEVDEGYYKMSLRRLGGGTAVEE